MDLNPRFRFEAFVVGPSNQVAAAAARAAAETPGAAYDPLFIYGESGLGKTHLLQAVGFHAQEQHPGLRVEYATLEELVERLHAAVAAGQLEAWRRSALETDVLLLDDVQFLADHQEMQAELLRLAEALPAAGRQLVLTCDRPPTGVPELDERLATRLAGGLLVDVAPPEYETRLAIVRRKVVERGASLPEPVLETVAQLGAANVRELTGMVNRLIGFQAVSDGPITPDAARALLEGELPSGTVVAAGPVPRAAPPTPARGGLRRPEIDEFSSFVTAVTHTVTQTVEVWRARIGEAVLRWQGEGYRTGRLEQLLHAEAIPDVAATLDAYAAAVDELRRLADDVAAYDPSAAGHACLRDPDRLDEARAFAAKVREGVAPPPSPSRGLSLDGYVVGSANEAAVRAARRVAEAPGREYNPLFIAGASGTGKTHLLHAIGNALLAQPPAPVVACLSAQVFVDELASAREAGRLEWWRRRYRRADALLLDDVHLLAGHDAAQEELYGLFNAFADAGRQLALTGERPPGELAPLAPRLRSRCEGGLVTDLAPPDRPMRAEMVRRLLAVRTVRADADVVDYLAARPADSARAVQGLVNRALAQLDPAAEALTLAVARLAIEGRPPRISQVQAVSAPVPSGLDAVLSSREKVVWDWPAVGDRIIEELR